MLTLCSEICSAKGSESVTVRDAMPTCEDEQGRKGYASSSGANGSKSRASDDKPREKPGEGDASASSATPGPLPELGGSSSAHLNGSSVASGATQSPNGSAPGAFGVLRQPTATSVLQNALKNEVRVRNEELVRLQHEDEQRSTLVVSLEQEVFEKERYLSELKLGMEKLGIGDLDDLLAEAVAPTAETLAAKERERLQQEIRHREGEATDLQQRVGALEELIREKRAEVVAKGEATLQLLFQLSSTPAEERVAANPLMQASPAIVTE